MHFIRRAAFRAATSPSTSFISKSRSINTSSPFAALRSKTQSSIPSTAFRRYASDEANSSEGKSSVESADSDDHGAVRSAIDSATESVSTYASDAAESLTNNAEQAKDTVVDGAAAAASGLGFSPREDRTNSRPSYGGRDGRQNDRRDNGGGRGGYGGDKDVGRGFGENRGFREPPRMTPCPNIYVGNLLFDVTASDLEREFGGFGGIQSAVIASDPRGLSKGFGYIQFETTEQATAAIEAKHQTVYEGRRLVCNYQAATKREMRDNPPSKTLFIGNLAFEMSDADLNKLFRDIRNVIDVRVAIDRRTGQPRGFAHADFVDIDSAREGKEKLAQEEIYGRKLRVDFSAGSGSSSGRGDRDGGGDRSRGGDRNGDSRERRERY